MPYFLGFLFLFDYSSSLELHARCCVVIHIVTPSPSYKSRHHSRFFFLISPVCQFEPSILLNMWFSALFTGCCEISHYRWSLLPQLQLLHLDTPPKTSTFMFLTTTSPTIITSCSESVLPSIFYYCCQVRVLYHQSHHLVGII
jgi:hypothetical protein